MVPSSIRTARLTLRAPKPEDAWAIFSGYARDADVVRYLLWKSHATLEESRRFVQGCIEGWGSGLRYPWVIAADRGGDIVGMIELRLDLGTADVGFALRKTVWGRGLATEALRAVLETGLSIPLVRHVWAICHVDNHASARVLEKAGMTREARWPRHEVFPNLSTAPQDVYYYLTPARPEATHID
jgi:RimJ/RimL family protein N-acetyltransferase